MKKDWIRMLVATCLLAAVGCSQKPPPVTTGCRLGQPNTQVIGQGLNVFVATTYQKDFGTGILVVWGDFTRSMCYKAYPFSPQGEMLTCGDCQLRCLPNAMRGVKEVVGTYRGDYIINSYGVDTSDIGDENYLARLDFVGTPFTNQNGWGSCAALVTPTDEYVGLVRPAGGSQPNKTNYELHHVNPDGSLWGVRIFEREDERLAVLDPRGLLRLGEPAMTMWAVRRYHTTSFSTELVLYADSGKGIAKGHVLVSEPGEFKPNAGYPEAKGLYEIPDGGALWWEQKYPESAFDQHLLTYSPDGLPDISYTLPLGTLDLIRLPAGGWAALVLQGNILSLMILGEDVKATDSVIIANNFEGMQPHLTQTQDGTHLIVGWSTVDDNRARLTIVPRCR